MSYPENINHVCVSIYSSKSIVRRHSLQKLPFLGSEDLGFGIQDSELRGVGPTSIEVTIS